MRRLPPGQFQAMGTNGLEPTELRAVYHALAASKASGAPALRVSWWNVASTLPEDSAPSACRDHPKAWGLADAPRSAA